MGRTVRSISSLSDNHSNSFQVAIRLARYLGAIPEALDVESPLAVALQHGKEESMSARNRRAFLGVLLFALSAATELYPADKTSVELSRDSIIRIVTQIQRADYEGDCPALKRLHDELTPIP